MGVIFQNVRELKAVLPQGKTITLVGGCFDLFHVGHVHLLEYAASLEDMLVVAVLSDTYVRGYKNPERPIINEKQRAMVVANSRFADLVYVSDVSSSSPETLQLLKPDSVVFGEESEATKKMQRRMTNIERYSPGTKVRLLPRYVEEHVSTGSIIRKIRGI